MAGWQGEQTKLNCPIRREQGHAWGWEGWERAGRGQVSYLPRIGQNRLYGRAGFLVTYFFDVFFPLNISCCN